MVAKLECDMVAQTISYHVVGRTCPLETSTYALAALDSDEFSLRPITPSNVHISLVRHLLIFYCTHGLLFSGIWPTALFEYDM